MNVELFFLRSDISDSPVSRGYRWSLNAVKVGGKTGHAYLAFRSLAMATLVAERFAGYSVVALTELNGEHAFNFDKVPLVLFDSVKSVEDFLSDREHYSYDPHLFRYSREHGLSKLKE